MEKYTTKGLKEKILSDVTISDELKEKEKKKIEISDDAFSICDFIDNLNNKLEHLRRSFIK